MDWPEMCAIVDNNVVAEVFGDEDSRPEAGQQFRKKIDSGKIILVLGGKLRSEIEHKEFRRYWTEATKAGRVKNCDDGEVRQLTGKIKDTKSCKSNDEHIIALAQISGARLLYTNDEALQTDFQEYNFVSGPGGKIYTTKIRRDYSSAHKRLLRDDTLRDLCRRQ